jgi:hypothetical protein
VARRYNAYFVTEKWVYDKAARRRANKAHDTQGHARNWIIERFPDPWSPGYDPYEELVYEDAVKLLDAAADRVNKAENDAHAIKKAQCQAT